MSLNLENSTIMRYKKKTWGSIVLHGENSCLGFMMLFINGNEKTAYHVIIDLSVQLEAWNIIMYTLFQVAETVQVSLPGPLF